MCAGPASLRTSGVPTYDLTARCRPWHRGRVGLAGERFFLTGNDRSLSETVVDLHGLGASSNGDWSRVQPVPAGGSRPENR
jgi:hypothetical protein